MKCLEDSYFDDMVEFNPEKLIQDNVWFDFRKFPYKNKVILFLNKLGIKCTSGNINQDSYFHFVYNSIIRGMICCKCVDSQEDITKISEVTNLKEPWLASCNSLIKYIDYENSSRGYMLKDSDLDNLAQQDVTVFCKTWVECDVFMSLLNSRYVKWLDKGKYLEPASYLGFYEYDLPQCYKLTACQILNIESGKLRYINGYIIALVPMLAVKRKGMKIIGFNDLCICSGDEETEHP